MPATRPVTPTGIERAHAVINRKVADVLPAAPSRSSWAATTRSPFRRRRRSRRGRASPLGRLHFDAHADAANSIGGDLRSHGTPMRRLIESGAVAGRNFVQVGLRGYWPPAGDVRLDARAGDALAPHAEVEERGRRR